MKKEDYKQVAEAYEDTIRIAQGLAMLRLKDAGIYVGALVKRHYDGAVYEITSIDFSSTPGWLSGRKQRKDNSFGTHEHPIGCPHDVKYIGYKVKK